jgi:hypothetical protein
VRGPRRARGRRAVLLYGRARLCIMIQSQPCGSRMLSRTTQDPG